MREPAAFTTKARKGAVDDGASAPTPSFQHGAGERVKHNLYLDHPIPREALLRLPEVMWFTGVRDGNLRSHERRYVPAGEAGRSSDDRLAGCACVRLDGDAAGLGT